jgi:hypothetical protein
MKDGIYLMVAALACAGGAWVFWSSLGQEAFSVFSTVVLLLVASDNIRLRRKLRGRDIEGRQFK